MIRKERDVNIMHVGQYDIEIQVCTIIMVDSGNTGIFNIGGEGHNNETARKLRIEDGWEAKILYSSLSPIQLALVVTNIQVVPPSSVFHTSFLKLPSLVSPPITSTAPLDRTTLL